MHADRSVTYLNCCEIGCIIPSMFMSPGSLPQAHKGSLDMNYEVSLLDSLTAATKRQNNPSVLVVYVNGVNPVQLYTLDSTVSFHVFCQ